MLDSFVKVTDKRFNEIDKRFDGVDKRFVAVDKSLIFINNRIDRLDERLGLVDRRLAKVEVTVLDMQDEIRGALNALDKDSIKILDHEKRIRRLEKVR